MRDLRTQVDDRVCVAIVQGDIAVDMELEGSDEDVGHGSARGKKKWMVDTPSAEENANDDDGDSSDGEDVHEVSSSVCECLRVRVCVRVSA